MTLAHQSYVHEIPNLLTVVGLGFVAAIAFLTAMSIRTIRAEQT